VEKAFSPEFRNRLDGIIPFGALDIQVAKNIVTKEVKKLSVKLAAKKVKLVVEEDCISYLAEEGYSPLYGARNIARLVDEKIATALVDEILFGQLSGGGKVICQLQKKGEDSTIAFEFSA
jgi:ATP-dependent Clp protease ATP-binding subunit ClpA